MIGKIVWPDMRLWVSAIIMLHGMPSLRCSDRPGRLTVFDAVGSIASRVAACARPLALQDGGRDDDGGANAAARAAANTAVRARGGWCGGGEGERRVQRQSSVVGAAAWREEAAISHAENAAAALLGKPLPAYAP
uniref:Uncharacterized protein n=1 Tax=Haptolina brevifila TaxID=156173 RepID=A0A7S2BT49_9EUKA